MVDQVDQEAHMIDQVPLIDQEALMKVLEDPMEDLEPILLPANQLIEMVVCLDNLVLLFFQNWIKIDS